MRISKKMLVSSILCFTHVSMFTYGETSPSKATENSKEAFQAFTGKIIKNKVRLRLQPNLESSIVRELKKDSLLLVTGQTQEFYQVEPPSDVKAFVYRPYVLDGAIVGDRVNIRLEPHLQSPILAQMNNGDKVNGTISTTDNKWLEIAPPSGTHFFVAKENVEKIGDKNYMATAEKRKNDLKNLLETTISTSNSEMEKPFPEIRLDTLITNYNKIIREYTDFPDEVKTAKDHLANLEEKFLQKKLHYLESKVQTSTSTWNDQNFHLATEMEAQKNRIKELEEQLKNKDGKSTTTTMTYGNSLTAKMTAWLQVEKNLYEEWLKDNSGKSPDEFYADQQKTAETLQGIIEPYDRQIKNKPGDFVLLQPSNQMRSAYLYSTRVDLDAYVGKNVKLTAVKRANYDYAYPAWFVIAVE